jgi:hypothetical protein
MSSNEFNTALWNFQNGLGWWFWTPFVVYGVTGLAFMYRLAPAVTTIGRIVRTVFTVALVSMVFIPQFNGLGSYAFHLVTIGAVLLIYQQYTVCRDAGKARPSEAPTALGRAVAKMVDRQVK